VAWGRLLQRIDLDSLTAELVAVVDQTMQPTRVPVWLRPSRTGAALGDAAAWRQA
jgi:hypothetical protein